MNTLQDFIKTWKSHTEATMIIMDINVFKTLKKDLELIVEETSSIYYGEITDEKLKDTFKDTMFLTLGGKNLFIRTVPRLTNKYEFYKQV